MIVSQRPTLRTRRLVLRPFSFEDAPVVQRLAGDRDIAATTLNIPHPYKGGMAEEWIGTHQEQFEKGEQAVFAITIASTGELVGAIGLGIRTEHRRAELGYWVGKPYWNHGYCTEAAAAVVQWGFDRLGLERIHATHFARNPASGRVMQKLGMKHEGMLRGHIYKWGVPEDLECYGILRSEVETSAHGRGADE